MSDALRSASSCRARLPDQKADSWKARVLTLVVSCEQCLAG